MTRAIARTLACVALLACSAEPRLRAVSLSPAISQVAAALGLADAVTPVDPRAPDALGRAMASGAQLALADGGPESADVRAMFAARNVTVRVFAPQTTDEVFAAYRELAVLLGDPAAGDRLVKHVNDELAKLAAANAAGAPRAKVALVLQRKPLRVVGSDGFVSKLLAAAGADNAFGDLSAASVVISPELLAQRAPRQLDVPSELAAMAWVDPVGAARRLREMLADAPR